MSLITFFFFFLSPLFPSFFFMKSSFKFVPVFNLDNLGGNGQNIYPWTANYQPINSLTYRVFQKNWVFFYKRLSPVRTLRSPEKDLNSQMLLANSRILRRQTAVQCWSGGRYGNILKMFSKNTNFLEDPVFCGASALHAIQLYVCNVQCPCSIYNIFFSHFQLIWNT